MTCSSFSARVGLASTTHRAKTSSSHPHSHSHAGHQDGVRQGRIESQQHTLVSDTCCDDMWSIRCDHDGDQAGVVLVQLCCNIMHVFAGDACV